VKPRNTRLSQDHQGRPAIDLSALGSGCVARSVPCGQFYGMRWLVKGMCFLVSEPDIDTDIDDFRKALGVTPVRS